MSLAARLRGWPGRLRRTFRTLSLRSRLLLGLVLVTAIGLGTADAIVYEQIQSYLVKQVDGQLSTTIGAMRDALQRNLSSVPGAPVGTWGVLLGTDNSVSVERCVVASDQAQCPATAPVLPRDVLDQLADAPSQGLFFSTAATGQSSYEYRVLGENSNFGLGPVLIAVPLGGVNGTLDRLILIDLGVSVVVLGLLGALGYAVVRIGLRPLVEIEETAGAIASGDLSQRVEREDERTELGRLGGALNVMLSQIETAFGEQKASEERLRQFLADASHELRTPVTSIRGYAELFRRGAATRPEDLARALRRIEDESIRMGVLVDDLLLLARLDQGRPLERGRVDLATVAIDVAADAQMLAPTRTIEVDAPSPVIVTGDEQRLRQIVANYMQNALRHTDETASIEVAVSTNGSLARVSVTDHGQGIDAEHIGRVFERFYRADPSRTRESGGAGLGLSIVASIAEAHGGRAWVESTPGLGAMFVVELPLANDEMTLSEESPDSPSTPSTVVGS